MAEERLLCIIKPDAVRNGCVDRIKDKLEKNGFRIKLFKQEQFNEKRVHEFYYAWRNESFYNHFIRFMLSGPIMVMVLEGENAIDKFAKLKGATDPKKAERGTFRAEFGSNVTENAIHGSDRENVEKEINFFFAPTQKKTNQYSFWKDPKVITFGLLAAAASIAVVKLSN